MGTPRYHSDPSWEPYVAEVISSLVIQVLRDDQVFAVLGGESRGPRRHSPLLCDPLQETMDCSMKIDGYNGMILVCGLFTYIHADMMCFGSTRQSGSQYKIFLKYFSWMKFW